MDISLPIASFPHVYGPHQSPLDDVAAKQTVTAIDIVTIIFGSCVAGRAAYDLRSARQEERGKEEEAASKSERGDLIIYPQQNNKLSCLVPSQHQQQLRRRSLNATRIITMAAAVCGIIRSGLHIPINNGTLSTYFDFPYDLEYPYSFFGFGTFILCLTVLVRLNSYFLAGYLPKDRRRQAMIGDRVLTWPLFVLWVVLTLGMITHSAMRYSASIDRVRAWVNNSLLILCGWTAVVCVFVATRASKKLVHATRAGITGPERRALARYLLFILLPWSFLNALGYLFYILWAAAGGGWRRIDGILAGEGPEEVAPEMQSGQLFLWIHHFFSMVTEIIGLPVLMWWALRALRVLERCSRVQPTFT
ncbi:hypothetical protein B0H66DRAFT_566022 [Apodospora peruviana]|uniref:Uncharacterized protein n=1 Tax=Apodospora peruviana TaxID=516989 RepID=A0AAE0LZH7_9PEZI|nr:hypothetical protein B0H66DRAFT_566022 [Apodospora peruviana]